MNNSVQLRAQFHSLQIDSGKKPVHQSHKTIISPKSLQMFNRMANSKDILQLNPQTPAIEHKKVTDTYLGGISKFYDVISGNDPSLRKLRLHFSKSTIEKDMEESEDEDSSDGSDM